ncbi:rhomboid family intramembrane serine protease [Parvularcula sp. IMCC14364]|uniref:rhomboid family intramembrane serine protease n=1 Tax=Parvularcula sp. IMCC14364 TaxID=3067902 RepID=UPI002740A0E8|nr:rhomboid family intramembrane serine protease [Parvularcula sp. IMCC14364]
MTPDRPSERAGLQIDQAAPNLWRPASAVVMIPMLLFVAVYAFLAFLPEAVSVSILDRFALSPLKVTGVQAVQLSSEEILLTFLTHVFLHADVVHLLVNCFWFYIFAQPLAVRFRAARHFSLSERITGSFVFMALFLSASVFSGLCYILMNTQEAVILIGASGAISAVMGASIRLGLRRYQPGGISRGRPLSIIDPKVLLASSLYIGSNLLLLTPYGDYLLFGAPAGQVAWEAHISGFLFGLVMLSYFDRLTLPRR